MADFNTKYILPGDNKDIILDKINYNFYQVFFNGVGEEGPVGDVGATGLRGQAGRDGNHGATGERAANWYFSSTEPTAAESQQNDIWINTGSTGGQQVYIYSSGSWVYTGETLLSSGQFATLIGASGPGGSTDNNAIYINGNSINKSLVLSDAIGTTGDINPNLAKLLISTNTSSTSDFPLLGFAKTFLTQTPNGIPSLKWKEVGGNYKTDWILPGNSIIQSGLTGSYSATGGTANISSAGITNITSQSTMTLTGATGVSGAFAFTTNGILNFTSSNVNLSTSVASVVLGIGGTAFVSAVSTPSTPLVYLQGPGGGMIVQSTADTSNQLLQVLDVNDKVLMSSGRQNKFVFGGSGATGFKETKRISTTSPVTFPTFTRGAFTNNYLDCGSPTNDLCLVTPSYSGSSSADGRSNRVYLSVGSNYSWATDLVSIGQSRAFDFYLNSSTYSFGGIRAVTAQSGGINSAQINDLGSGATGCQHIRLTFFDSSVADFHYQAFSNTNYSCGWITYTVAELAPGAGGSKSFF